VKPFYLDMSAIEPELSGNPQGDFRFDVSYGDPQTVQVLAARSVGAVTANYRINGGAVRMASTKEWKGGERFGGPGDVYYHVMRGQVTGTNPGDRVEVWFAGGGQRSDSFTYTAKSESSNRVLVVSAEDYSGISPVYKKADGRTTSRTTSTRSPRTASAPTCTTSTRTVAVRPTRSAS
jgi:hypothetical protein